MGLFKIGAEVCNNCIHWQCHAQRMFRGNPPTEVYTDSNQDKCGLTGRSTVSKETCNAFSHIGGVSKTFAFVEAPSAGEIYVQSLMDDLVRKRDELIRERDRKCKCAEQEEAEDSMSEEEMLSDPALKSYLERCGELGVANGRIKELLEEGLNPKYMCQFKSIEFMHLLDQARSGDPQSQYDFAKAFWEGSHGALDERSLLTMNKLKIPHDWCRKAAENGLVEAQYRMGHSGWDGEAKSIEWLKKAASQGHGKAKAEFEELAAEIAGNSKELLKKCITLLKNRKNDEEIEDAISYIRKASSVLDRSEKWKDSVPLHKLDEKFVDDFVEAIENIAELGIPELQNAIGKMFGAYSSFEYIVKKDDKRAVHWFECAAKAGCLDAMDNLGICFANGDGVIQSDEAAAAWYRKAAQGGLDWGQYHYACRLISGEGVEKDLNEARNWLRKAAEQGLKKAEDRLDILDDESDADNPSYALRAGWKFRNQRNYSAAVRYFMKAEKFGLPEAKYALGRCYYLGDGVDKNEATATIFFKEATKTWFADSDPKLAHENMYSDACDKLGDCFLAGNDAAKDVAEAIGYYKRAAHCSYAEASKELGYDFLKGCSGVSKDVAQAVYWLQHSTWSDDGSSWGGGKDSYTIEYLEEAKSAFESDGGKSEWIDLLEESADDFKLAYSGDADAQVRVGNRFFTGDGVDEKDLRASVYWWHRAAVGGHSMAQCKVGMAYYFGKGVEENEPEAFKWFEKAALQGDAEAMCRYAECFRYGNGTDMDFGKAIEWYRKSAEAGNALAQENLAMMYYKGLGAEKNLKEAFKWFKEAAGEDREKSQFWVGKFYAEGLGGVEKDLGKAVEWYEKAAEQDNTDAICALGWCYQLGNGVEQDFEKAVEWFRKGADNDCGVCMNNLARLIEEGKGIEQDYGEAIMLFKKAVENDCNRAKYHIGRFYENGLGVDTDVDTAKEWYRKAADNGDKDAKAALERLGCVAVQ